MPLRAPQHQGPGQYSSSLHQCFINTASVSIHLVHLSSYVVLSAFTRIQDSMAVMNCTFALGCQSRAHVGRVLASHYNVQHFITTYCAARFPRVYAQSHFFENGNNRLSPVVHDECGRRVVLSTSSYLKVFYLRVVSSLTQSHECGVPILMMPALKHAGKRLWPQISILGMFRSSIEWRRCLFRRRRRNKMNI
jgi:hypothetical protein